MSRTMIRLGLALLLVGWFFLWLGSQVGEMRAGRCKDLGGEMAGGICVQIHQRNGL